jgi:hypothetical protein
MRTDREHLMRLVVRRWAAGTPVESVDRECEEQPQLKTKESPKTHSGLKETQREKPSRIGGSVRARTNNPG